MPVFLLFAGAFSAILLTGSLDQGALGILLVTAGAVILAAKPGSQLSWRIWTLAGAFLLSTALSFLPLEWSTIPQWRQELQAAAEIPLGTSITPVPRETLWWWGLLAISVGVALFVLTRHLRSRDQLVVANSVVLCTAAYGGLAIVSELTGWRFAFDEQSTFGFFRNRNHTASFLMIGAVTSLGIIGLPRELGHRSSRWFAFAAFALCAVALISFSMSRAGVIFLALGTTIWLLGTQVGKRSQSRSLVITGMLLGVLLLFIIAGGTARQRVLAIIQLEEATKHNDTKITGAEPLDFRFLIFQDTWRMIKDHPWTGTGLGTYSLLYPQYQNASLRNATAKHPESDWLMLASEGGIPAVICLAALILTVTISLRRFQKHPYWSLRWGLFSAAAAAALHSVIDVPAHRVPLGWWIVLLGAASLRLTSSGRPSHWCQRGAFAGVGVAGMLLGGGLINAEWFGGNSPAPFRAEQTQQLVAEAAIAGNSETAIRLSEEGIDSNPLSSGFYHQLGTLLLVEGDDVADIDRAFRAERLLQPTWPEIPYRQGKAWLSVDASRTAMLWAEAVNRQRRIDRQARVNETRSLLIRMLRESRSAPDVQLALLSPDAPHELTWKWLEAVPKPVFDVGIERLSRDADFLESLTPSEKLRFVQIWANRGEPAILEAFLKQRAGWDDLQWPLQLRAAIERKDYEDATKLLIRHYDVSLALPEESATAAPRQHPIRSPIERFMHHWAQGREISARAALTDALASGAAPPEAYRWQTCLAVRDGEWKQAYSLLRKYLAATERLPQ